MRKHCRTLRTPALFAVCWMLFFSPFLLAEDLDSFLRGPTSNRVDIVFLGDGYQEHELDTYDEHIDGMLAHMFAQQPFSRYREFFNVHRISVISNESGADVPPDGEFVDTALGAKYYFDGTTERLLYIDQSKADQVLLRSIPLDENIFTPEMQFVAINSSRYGGAGGVYSTFAGASSDAYEIAVHEVAHSFSNLTDEYFFTGTTYTSGEPAHPNVTVSPDGEKWAHWLGYQQPGIGRIDVYEGGFYHEKGVYRPSDNSKMRQLGRPFDAVSREQLVLDIYRHVDPIDQHSEATSIDPNAPLWVDTIDPEVIDLTWSVNGDVVDVEASEGLGLNEMIAAGYLPGRYDISVLAADNTDWVRIRQDELQQTLSWDSVGYFPGDFDDNEILNALDIDSLSDAVATSSTDLTFDMNGDGIVDERDRSTWVSANQTHFGDVNLDGTVSFPDFLILSENFGQPGGWADGNFTTDDLVGFPDFLILSENFGSSRTAASGINVVPEPSGLQLTTLVTVAMLCVSNRRQRRGGLT